MTRVLQCLTVLILLTLAWGCPKSPPNPTPTPGGSAPATKPTPGPIIVLTPGESSPGSGVYVTAWTVADTMCAANAATESGTMRLDGFGKVTTMRVWKKDGTFVDVTGALSLGFTVQDVDGNFHAIEIRRTPKGYFQWKSNSVALQICDMASSDCLANCQNPCGLPKDFFGTISSGGQFAGVDISNVSKVEFLADYTNPCQ
jgi:hypothetical protein